MNKDKEIYLGDGLYARDEGFQIVLRAPRMEGDHWVGLDDYTLESLLRFIERTRKVKIEITKEDSHEQA